MVSLRGKRQKSDQYHIRSLTTVQKSQYRKTIGGGGCGPAAATTLANTVCTGGARSCGTWLHGGSEQMAEGERGYFSSACTAHRSSDADETAHSAYTFKNTVTFCVRPDRHWLFRTITRRRSYRLILYYIIHQHNLLIHIDNMRVIINVRKKCTYCCRSIKYYCNSIILFGDNELYSTVRHRRPPVATPCQTPKFPDELGR